MRNLNLVFQGGGVKGIAYAGALQSLPDDCQIKGVGGTSAGALVAALVAIGKRGKELRAVLEDPKLFKLIETEEAERYERIKKILSFARSEQFTRASEDLKGIWKTYNQSGLFGWKKLTIPQKLSQFKKDHADILSHMPRLWDDLTDCWRKKGFHSSLPLRRWLDEVLEGKTFEDLTRLNIDLRIVTADVSSRKYYVFETDRNKGDSIAGAVHASVSIPIFFEPLMSGTECFVDGGMLSNFPHFLFAQSPFPTVGFELVENTPTMDCTTTIGFLAGLLGTMITSHDKHRKRPPYFQAYQISTPDYIPFDKFDLTERDVNELYALGENVGGKVRWLDDDHSSEKELVVYYDPLSDKVLDNALKQASLLIEDHIHPKSWVDQIYQNVGFRVKVDENWNARYDRRDEIKVVGTKPLVLQRIILKVPREVGKFQSLADTEPRCIDDTNGDQKPLVHLPAFNGETEKGFVVFYSPPISGDEVKPRKIQTSVGMKREFAEVKNGERGSVSLSMTRRASIHLMQIRVEIWLHRSLPQMGFEPNFTGATYGTSVETLAGRRYDVHSWSLPQMPHETITFPLAVAFRVTENR
jgi:predicted acylesterase/phospholipase RssA